jgi:hypothetical protein
MVTILQSGTMLDSKLSVLDVTREFQAAVVSKLWSTQHAQYEYSPDLDGSYFHHIYEELCKNACGQDQDVQLATRVSHDDILNIAIQLKDVNTRPEILLASLGGRTVFTERCLRLAAGMMLPFHFDGAGGKRLGKSILWDLETPLTDCINDKLRALLPRTLLPDVPSCQTCGDPISQQPLEEAQCLNFEHGSSRFSYGFSAQKLAYVAGFEVVWTSNLLDHLRIDDVDEKLRVYIFHHVTLLDHITSSSGVYASPFIQLLVNHNADYS